VAKVPPDAMDRWLEGMPSPPGWVVDVDPQSLL
jgi:hypothetical protein